jgi:hypothetical protein
LIQADGKIISTGRTFANNSDISLSRFKSNGELDSTFGTNGFVNTDIAAGDDFSFGSLIQPDKKIVLTGFYTDAGVENMLVCRYTNDSLVSNIPAPHHTSFILYPQPATDHVTIHLDLIPGDIVHAELFSSEGKIIRKYTLNNFSQTIDVSSISPGAYFIKLKGSNHQFKSKLFIKK